MSGIVGEVVPLMRIGLEVVEFLEERIAVKVAKVLVSFCSDSLRARNAVFETVVLVKECGSCPETV